MSKAIILTKVKWYKLMDRLLKDYPRSVTMIRSKMREVLGFVDREHEEWYDSRVDPYDELVGDSVGFKYRGVTVHLDFYDEKKRTMFLMKYSEYL